MNETTPEERARLRRIAECAIDSARDVETDTAGQLTVVNTTAGVRRELCSMAHSDAKALDDAALIAAMDRRTVLALLADVERLEASLRSRNLQQRYGACEVCWTASWAPCEASAPGAVADPSRPGEWMVCQQCSVETSIRRLGKDRNVWETRAFAAAEEARESTEGLRGDFRQVRVAAWTMGAEAMRQTILRRLDTLAGYNAGHIDGAFGDGYLSAFRRAKTIFAGLPVPPVVIRPTEVTAQDVAHIEAIDWQEVKTIMDETTDDRTARRRLVDFVAGTDEEIQAEIAAMPIEEVRAELVEAGVDVDELQRRMREMLAEFGIANGGVGEQTDG